MKKKLTFLLALMLVSAMSWAAEQSVTIKYNSTFSPALPTASGSVHSSATANTVEGLAIKETGIYKGASSNYIMFVQDKGYIYNTESLGTIKSVAVTYSSGTSTTAKAGVYFGSTEQSTYTTSSNATIKGQSKTDTWTNTTAGNGYFQLSTSNKNCQITEIYIIYEPASGGTPTCATPTFSVAAGQYLSAQSVTLSCTTENSTIYYTTDGNDPTTSSSVYSSAIAVNADMTIKAIAAASGYDNSSVASASYIIGAWTVAQARAAIDAGTDLNNKYATGIVSEIVTEYSSQYGNISYNISDDGLTTSDQLQAYRGKSYNGDNFTSADDIQVGDVVVVCGTLKKYNSTYEFDQNNQLVSLSRKSLVSIAVKTAPTKVSYEAGEYFDPTGLVITATYDDSSTKDITYAGNAGDFSFSPSLSTALTTANTSVTITYKGQTVNQVITVTATPFLEATPTAIDFGTVVKNAAVGAQTFSISGQYLTQGTLTIAAPSGYSVSPTSVNVNGTLSATEITVTPSTTAVGTFNGNVTISGGGLASNVTVALSMTVKDVFTVTWNVNGVTSTTNVTEGEKPVFPATPASCDATSDAFYGWATAAWEGKTDDISLKTIYTSASQMPEVDANGTIYYAVFAAAESGTEDENAGPSWSRSETTDTYTTGYTFSSTSGMGKSGYYQDASSGVGELKLYHTSSAIFSTTPNRVVLTASIGGGSSDKDLTNSVYAQLLDDEGEAIGNAKEITSHITTNTGDTYNIELDLTGITSAYGVKVYHEKESGYNVRYYSFNLKYYTGGTTYSDYMTTCCTKHDVTLAGNGEVSGEGTFSADINSACEGTTITITAVPNSTHTFSGITVVETADPTNALDAGDIIVSGNEAAFDMPDYDVTVTAVFASKPCTQLGTPSVSVPALQKTYSSAVLTWAAIDNADYYEVHIIKDAADVESDDMFIGTSYSTTTELLGNTTYQYTVQAISLDDVSYCASELAQGSFTTDQYPAVTIILSENGVERELTGIYLKTPFALPTDAENDCTGKTLAGWGIEPITTATNTTPAMYAPGESYTVNTYDDQNPDVLYAVFVKDGETGYKLQSSAPANGDKIIMARKVTNTYYALNSSVGTTALTISDGIVSSPADAVIWDIATANTGVYIYPTGQTTNSLHMNSSALKVAQGATNGDIKFTSNGNGTFKGIRADDSRWIVTSGENGLGCSATEDDAAELYIFKYGTSASSYATACSALATDIEDIEGADIELPRAYKVIENGVLYIVYEGVRYNVMGMQVR